MLQCVALCSIQNFTLFFLVVVMIIIHNTYNTPCIEKTFAANNLVSCVD